MIYSPFDKGFRVIEHGRGRRAVDATVYKAETPIFRRRHLGLAVVAVSVAALLTPTLGPAESFFLPRCTSFTSASAASGPENCYGRPSLSTRF